jgi:predicted DNA-binding ArsR family transcriptional regulator
MNDNINMDSTIVRSVNDNINMDSTIVRSVNDNINIDSTIVRGMDARSKQTAPPASVPKTYFHYTFCIMIK